MTSYVIRDMFRLASGSTVFAVEGNHPHPDFSAKTVKLANPRELRQSIRLIGEMHVKKLDPSNKLIALETKDDVRLTVAEARSGNWSLTTEYQ